MAMASDIGVAEQLSREARGHLLNLVKRKVENNLREERRALKMEGKKVRRGRLGTIKALAKELGVKVPTVKAWLIDRWQAGNPNATIILKKAYELDPKGTRQVLIQDLEKHATHLERFFQTDIGTWKKQLLE